MTWLKGSACTVSTSANGGGSADGHDTESICCLPSVTPPVPCRAMKCRVVPCRAVSCRAVPCRAVPSYAVPCRPCRAVPCRAVPCRVMPCRAVPCRAVPCCVVLCRAVPCRVPPCYEWVKGQGRYADVTSNAPAQRPPPLPTPQERGGGALGWRPPPEGSARQRRVPAPAGGPGPYCCSETQLAGCTNARHQAGGWVGNRRLRAEPGWAGQCAAGLCESPRYCTV